MTNTLGALQAFTTRVQSLLPEATVRLRVTASGTLIVQTLFWVNNQQIGTETGFTLSQLDDPAVEARFWAELEETAKRIKD